MNISNVNSNPNVSLTKQVKGASATPNVNFTKEPIKNKSEEKAQAQIKDTFTKSSAKDLSPKTYNASGKVKSGNDLATTVAQSMNIQTNTPKHIETPKKVDTATTKKVQSIKSIDVRV